MPVLIASLNEVRLLRILHGAVCPCCARRKPEGFIVCIPCREKLCTEDRQRLAWVRFSGEHVREALAVALTGLHATAIYEPAPCQPCERLAVRPWVFQPARLAESLCTGLCPACAGPKEPGKRLCYSCSFVLKRAFLDQHNASKLSEARWDHYARSMSERAAKRDPLSAAEAFCHAFLMIDADTFYAPLNVAGERATELSAC